MSITLLVLLLLIIPPILTGFMIWRQQRDVIMALTGVVAGCCVTFSMLALITRGQLP